MNLSNPRATKIEQLKNFLILESSNNSGTGHRDTPTRFTNRRSARMIA